MNISSGQIWAGFTLGIIFHAGLGIMAQGALGLDLFLDSVRDNWINFHWTVGYGLSAAAIIIVQPVANVYQMFDAMPDNLDEDGVDKIQERDTFLKEKKSSI